MPLLIVYGILIIGSLWAIAYLFKAAAASLPTSDTITVWAILAGFVGLYWLFYKRRINEEHAVVGGLVLLALFWYYRQKRLT